MRKNLNKKALLAFPLAAMLFLAACSSGDNGGGGSTPTPDETATQNEQEKEYEPAEMTFAIASAVTGPKEEVAFYAVGKEMGYFAEENLEVNVVNTDGSAAGIQAVVSGSAAVTAGDLGSILAAAESGSPIVAIGGLVQNWPWVIGVPEGNTEITKVEDLKGKNIGVISLASGSAQFTGALANSIGLDPETDITMVPVGVGAQAQAALDAGEVDVLALYTQAYAVLENQGMKFTYLDNGPEFENLRSITFAADKNRVQEDPELYERFLRAAYKAMMFSVNNPEAALRMGYEVFPELLNNEKVEDRIDADLVVLQAWLDTASPKEGNPADFTNWGEITPEQWDATQNYTVLTGTIQESIPVDQVWIGDFITPANDWDSAEIVEQAKNWTE